MGLFSAGRWRLFDWLVLCAIGGLTLAVVVPNFMKARTSNGRDRACIPNLKQIHGAVDQWALENKISPTNTYSLTDPAVLAYMRGSLLPKCPHGGRYSPGTNIADTPKCSLPGHTL